jgi:hypothetical protein
MPKLNVPYGRIHRNKKAVAPAVSAVILTGAVIGMVILAMSFGSGFLNVQMAGNEFSANKQFMQTTGLQIDDVAWNIGRTDTVQYTSKSGQLTFVNATLQYTFETYDGTAWRTVLSCTTGIILYNLPVSAYTIGRNAFQRIVPASNGSFLQTGVSAPVSQVFATEKVPMADGNYVRIVAVPSIRLINSTIMGGQQQGYYKFYLPCLIAGSNPRLSQSVTLTGTNVGQTSSAGITQVRINATSLAVPSSPPGFDQSFFNFDHSSETVTIAQNSLVQFYTGTVTVSLGLNS